MANSPNFSYRAIVTLFLALSTSQCDNAQCERLRDDLMEQKLGWQGCLVDSDCIKVGGNSKDCTGIMSCDFAVHVDHRLEAERRVASLPEETQDCIECGSPNCVTGKIALCEPKTKTCILVTEILDPEETNGGRPSDATAGAPVSAGVSATAGTSIGGAQ